MTDNNFSWVQKFTNKSACTYITELVNSISSINYDIDESHSACLSNRIILID